ncbi:uncharacterized protein HaLaN_14046, partial [Haematococcus lacustris]
MVESVAIPASIKLFYFDLPGWAEATRLMFKLRGIPFDDVTFSHEEWPKFKPNMPFGQVPVLEVDGQQLAQTAAIERYVAKLTGMYPDDPWQAAKGEELSARAIKDPEQQAAARRAIVDGPLQAKLAKLNEVLGALGPDTFVAGSKDVTQRPAQRPPPALVPCCAARHPQGPAPALPWPGCLPRPHRPPARHPGGVRGGHAGTAPGLQGRGGGRRMRCTTPAGQHSKG